jgi:hypothetical protein
VVELSNCVLVSPVSPVYVFAPLASAAARDITVVELPKTILSSLAISEPVQRVRDFADADIAGKVKLPR